MAGKTKLLVYTTKHTELQSKVEVATTTINVDGLVISPSQEVANVGVLRSAEGNGPNISAGIAKGHQANPVALLRVEPGFAVPVLQGGIKS